MRRAINQNPIAQVALIGVLAVVVGFLVLTRVGGSNSTTSTTATTTPATAASPTSTAAPEPTTSAPAPSAAEPAPGTVPPAAVAPATGEFAAGPGLPASVVKAYAKGQTVVLLVARHRGVDDHALRPLVRQLGHTAGVALFTTAAKEAARYSRITLGVNLDRAPALVVLSPRDARKDGTPVASVSYGYRGFDSVMQTIRDARYKGPDLPYYPK